MVSSGFNAQTRVKPHSDGQWDRKRRFRLALAKMSVYPATRRIKTRMRSSKSRSRSKANRSRSMGNITNRVFDSSGPEGKVRGTPQQIIEKYAQLARDAQLGNDRVAAENFQQHAEHYTRMLGDAQREMEARREQQQNQQGGQNNQNHNAGTSGPQNGAQHGAQPGVPTAPQNGGAPQGGQAHGGQGQGQGQGGQGGAAPNGGADQRESAAPEAGAEPPSGAETPQQAPTPKPKRRSRNAAPRTEDAADGSADAVVALESGDSSESTLVETPESAPKPRRPRTRAKAKTAADAGSAEPDGSSGKSKGDNSEPSEAAE
ncbi:MAG: DUF4167 domain-containing protein [Pseudomonadota bacterium]